MDSLYLNTFLSPVLTVTAVLNTGETVDIYGLTHKDFDQIIIEDINKTKQARKIFPKPFSLLEVGLSSPHNAFLLLCKKDKIQFSLNNKKNSLNNKPHVITSSLKQERTISKNKRKREKAQKRNKNKEQR